MLRRVAVTDLQGQLGSNTPLGTLQITLFVPSVDRDSKPIEHEAWVDAALTTFGQLFRGATAFPPGRGVWRDDARRGTLVFDETSLVTSYTSPAVLTAATLSRLRAFLHRLGRDAGQGEVGLVVGGQYYGITAYDPEGAA